MRITREWLAEKDACQDAVEPFLAAHPDGAELTRELLDHHTVLPHFDWLAGELVDPSAWREAMAPINAAWHEAMAPIDAAWREAMAPIDAAWREAMAPINAAWGEAMAPIDAAREEAKAPIDAAWREAKAPINAAREEAKADALWALMEDGA